MSLLTVSVIGARFAFAEGRLPLRLVLWGPWRVAVAPPISPGWSPPFCREPLVLRSVFHTFPACRSARIHGGIFVSFADL